MTQTLHPAVAHLADDDTRPSQPRLADAEGELEHLVRVYQAAVGESDERGASQALEVICRKTAPDIAKFCALIAGPRVNALDAAQETMIEACRRLPTLREPRAFRGWLYSIARNKVMAQRRWTWVRRWVPGSNLEVHEDPSAGPFREMALSRRSQMVERVLDELPEDQRTAIALHVLQGLSDSEVAECLGKKKTNVKSLIRRAKESFRKAVGRLGYEEELSEALGDGCEGE
jgi:RNA polymerase sigma-70 factor, ECF subfamily